MFQKEFWTVEMTSKISARLTQEVNQKLHHRFFYQSNVSRTRLNHIPFRDPGSVCNDLRVFNSSIGSKKLFQFLFRCLKFNHQRFICASVFIQYSYRKVNLLSNIKKICKWKYIIQHTKKKIFIHVVTSTIFWFGRQQFVNMLDLH